MPPLVFQTHVTGGLWFVKQTLIPLYACCVTKSCVKVRLKRFWASMDGLFLWSSFLILNNVLPSLGKYAAQLVPLRNCIMVSIILPQVSVLCVFQALSINWLSYTSFWVHIRLAFGALSWWMILLFLWKFPAGTRSKTTYSSGGTYKEKGFIWTA